MFIFFLAFFAAQIEAKELVLRTPLVASEEFYEFLQKNPHLESLEERWQRELEENEKRLQNIFLKAQYEFLKGSTITAMELFKSLVQQSHNFDWQGASRKILVTSYFRLAQLEKAQVEKWVAAAEEFDSRLGPDPQLFPPPLQKLWQKMKDKNLALKWQPQWPLDLIDKVLVNGQRAPLTPFSYYDLHPLNNRVTIISNCGFIESKQGTASEILKAVWNFPRPAQGTCQDYQLAIDKKWGDVKVLFPNQCLISSEQKKLDLQPTAQHNVNTLDDSVKPISLESSSLQQSSSPPRWYKNKWLWMGLAAATSIALYQHQKTESADPVIKVKVLPTHKPSE